MDKEEQELLVATNRYYEGGKRDPADLIRIAEIIARSPDTETARRRLKIAEGQTPARK